MFGVIWLLCFPFFSGDKLNISTHVNICNVILYILSIIFATHTQIVLLEALSAWTTT
jgi:hypothetical protein